MHRALERSAAAPAQAAAVAQREDEQTSQRPRRAIRCAACGATVAWVEHAIEVQGAHRHDCTNPHGLRFEIVCYRRAPGCGAVGPATPEWSWFRGFAWRIGVCRECGAHLGWRYEGQDLLPFFGLIAERLRYPPDAPD